MQFRQALTLGVVAIGFLTIVFVFKHIHELMSSDDDRGVTRNKIWIDLREAPKSLQVFENQLVELERFLQDELRKPPERGFEALSDLLTDSLDANALPKPKQQLAVTPSTQASPMVPSSVLAPKFRPPATPPPQSFFLPMNGGKRVAVIIPFRDREQHLSMFKEYWRWYARDGSPPTVASWDVYVVEQFDSTTFNRGWTFNVGLAIASQQQEASPDLTQDMGATDFACAVIQDIDYLPERNVDYADCPVPMQLSAEIDRYGWKAPYLQNAGGIVSARKEDWKKINGFSNKYFGWGGEDDELFHRFRLSGLLFGDCYPFCETDDPNIGKPGQSLARPPKGYGRFSGEWMHSANHTKRITDSKAYDRNVKLLRQIINGNDRWKSDGLSDLAFRIVDYKEDRTDRAEFGITYRHVRVRRGRKDFNPRKVQLFLPTTLCDPSSSVAVPAWTASTVGDPLPFDFASLRQRAVWGRGPSSKCDSLEVWDGSFILLDLRKHLAKVFDSAAPRLLVEFFRSLDNPEGDGLIIGDPRSRKDVVAAFSRCGAVLRPPAEFSICNCPLRLDGPKYSVHQKPDCKGGGWREIEDGFFQAYTRRHDGLQAVTVCDNEKYWTQRIVLGEECPETWSDLKWVYQRTFWVPKGDSFCVGSRSQGAAEPSFSRILPQADCGGSGFQHELSFGRLAYASGRSSQGLCIGRSRSDPASFRISMKASCRDKHYELIARFPVRTAATISEASRSFCVQKDAKGDKIVPQHVGCGDAPYLIFSAPLDISSEKSRGRSRVCLESNSVTGVDNACGPAGTDNVFELPSALDIAESTAHDGVVAATAPLYTLVEEESECFEFICPTVS